MPIHRYTCRSCGDTRDYLHGMDTDPASCDACHSTFGLKRHLSVPNVGKSKEGSDPKFLHQALFVDPEKGLRHVGTTREVRVEGSPIVERTLVDLNTGEKLGSQPTVSFKGLF